MPNLFSSLTSKIFGATTLLMMIAFGLLLISKNSVIASQEKMIVAQDTQISNLKVDLSTARSNEATLNAGLSQCNASAQNAAQVANVVAKAGVDAVAQAQKAQADVAKQVARINALPAANDQDVDRILLEGAK